jgi:hypothetical protein
MNMKKFKKVAEENEAKMIKNLEFTKPPNTNQNRKGSAHSSKKIVAMPYDIMLNQWDD